MATQPIEGRSAGDLVRGLSEHFSTLIRSEIALAKLEIRDMIAKLGAGGALLAGALICILAAGVFMFVTLALALALVMPAWAATLIMAAAFVVFAAGLGWLGLRKLRGVEFVPAATVESVKTDVEVIRSDLQRLKERRSHEQ